MCLEVLIEGLKVPDGIVENLVPLVGATARRMPCLVYEVGSYPTLEQMYSKCAAYCTDPQVGVVVIIKLNTHGTSLARMATVVLNPAPPTFSNGNLAFPNHPTWAGFGLWVEVGSAGADACQNLTVLFLARGLATL